MRSSFGKVFMGAAGTDAAPSEDEFNRVSFLSHFEGANNGVNNAFDDGSANNHTITANGNVTQGSFGPFARPDGEFGVTFDGASDYLDANDGPTFGTGAFTIEFFVNLRTVGSTQAFFDSRPDGTNGLYPALFVYSNNKLVYYFNTGDRITSSETLSANTWYHIAICRSGTSTKLFLDGTQVGSTFSDSNNYPDSGRMRVGTSGFRVSDGFHLDGVISNVRVVNSALYTSNFTAPTGKLTAITNTKLLTCQSNRFVDNSADGLTMTPSGNAAVSAFGPFLTSAVYDAAVNGASAYLDGSGDYLTISASADFNFGTGDATLECWIYPASSVGMLFATGNASSSDQFGIFDSSEGLWWGQTSSNSSRPSGNQWAHVAVSREGNTIRRYINGVQASTGTNTGSIGSSSATAYVGRRPSGGHEFVGYIADLRVVKGTAVYTGASAFTPPTAPLTAITNTKLLLNMADGQAIDSAAQNNLTLVGNAKTSTAQKKFGDSSMVFAAGSGALAPKDFVAFGSGNFTVEFFVRFDNPSSLEFLIDGRPSATNGAYFTLYSSGGLLKYSTNNTVRITGSSALDADTFYHVAVCRSGTETKMFVDGTQIGSTYSDSNSYLTSDLNQIGGYTANSSFTLKGYMDELRISRMARYTSNFTAPAEPFADKGQ